MRKLLTLLVAIAIVAGAYTVTFGLPPSIAAMIPPGTGGDSAAGNGGAVPPAGGGARGPRGGSRATTVVTTPLEIQPYVNTLNAIGTASALRSVNVVANTAGTVTETNLTANRDVEAGEVLVRFDVRAQVLNLEIAQANLEQAQEIVARYERLRAGGASTVTDVTMSEALVKRRLAEAAVGLAQVALDDRIIRAPIAGKLGLSRVEIGDVITANSVIASIDQASALIVEFELPERAIGLLADAKTVLASTSTFAGRVFEGDIVSFDSRIDSVTRSVTVKARIENPDGVLWPGMTFAVRLNQESAPLPALPSTAITWSRAGAGVWIDADGAAKRVPVTILYRRNDTVWIDAEIAEGTMVVTEGAQKLRDGARISTPGGAGERRGRRGGAAGESAALGGPPARNAGSGDQTGPRPAANVSK
ncbi:efflux RND transporter periplasmic adaptor subunit [Oceaniglobus ichthyenteri]|uniref:efflux RND transporter periplasmic adaptor subunit n=1 Tax=Oceaniglobus ichthyenteri TaxID=2136177 RepID=UPI000D3642FD|nr:efflux RND transporter periplasmic adaptor subunit [Oceaniglobus ichthyenteri]